MAFGKAKRTVNIVFDDYIIRMVENNGKDLKSIRIVKEKVVPQNIIENGKIVDEPAFYNFMKAVVQEWGIKRRNVRFFAPQSLVILREVEVPRDVKQEDLKDYIHLEIGSTIHFPFKNPIFDIYPQKEASNKVTILAAPEDELLKYTEILSDVTLKPKVVEIQPLGIYRYFLHAQTPETDNKSYMIVEYNLNAVNISIFHNHQVEFIRHQPLSISQNYWKLDEETKEMIFVGDDITYQGEINDQLNEIDRMMNFYRFSIYQGDKEINELIVVGDSPHLENIARLMDERYSFKVTLLNILEQINSETVSRAYIPVLGLALQGGK